MSIPTRDVHRRLQHHDTEWDPRNPAHEANHAKNRKQQEDNRGAVVMPREVVRCSREAKDDVQDASDPDELLGEVPREEKVGPRKEEGEHEHEGEEDDSVGIEGEGVGAAVDAAAIEEVVAIVALEREAGDGGEAEKDEDQLEVEG